MDNPRCEGVLRQGHFAEARKTREENDEAVLYFGDGDNEANGELREVGDEGRQGFVISREGNDTATLCVREKSGYIWLHERCRVEERFGSVL